MGQLDSADRALRFDEVGDAAKGGDLGVCPETGAVGGDAPAVLDAGGFNHGERGTFEGVVS